MRNKHQKGFTLIELLVVIAIIGLLASVVLLALNSARAKSRDAKRLADIHQLQTALELFYNDAGGYPPALSGAPTTSGSITFTAYSQTTPTAPLPPDGTCTTAQNTYTYAPSGTGYTGTGGAATVYPNYSYTFCLGAATGSLAAGTHTASPAGIN
ncbi:type II secretion system GspH family protein [Patescibacteria group bacterium]|nr:type II secretion system GspH family protein [Patescibacteria group bacterium]